jgi:glucose/arabinose dehydrogenase
MTHRRRSRALIVLALVAAACSSDQAEPTAPVTFATSPNSIVTSTATTSPGTAPPVGTEPSGTIGAPTTPLTAAPTTGATNAPPAPTSPGNPVVTITQLGAFRQPVDVKFNPTNGTTYVVEQAGLVVIMKDGQPDTVALDMTNLTSAGGERGLLGLAIAPDGTLAYVDYTNNDGDTRIDEYAIAADGTFTPSSRRNVLGFAQPYPNHNGGEVVFGPDHMLYIGTGDGGAGGDPQRRALNVGEWLGKILRIDPHQSANGPYSVPPDNPFVAVAGARPEIWAVGLRNPWRFSFDRATGDLWIADVGQSKWEEVDAAWAADGGGRGMNFGWSAMEGNHRYNDDQPTDGATPPVYEYAHGKAGCSISGGVRYRGAAIPALVGWYVFGDYCGGKVRGLQVQGNAVTGEIELGAVPSISAVTEAADGELLVCSLDGHVYAITPG